MMLIHYVDWWDEERGMLRHHFGNVRDARKHFDKVEKISSGSTMLFRVELSGQKQAMINALNRLSLDYPFKQHASSRIVIRRKGPTP